MAAAVAALLVTFWSFEVDNGDDDDEDDEEDDADDEEEEEEEQEMLRRCNSSGGGVIGSWAVKVPQYEGNAQISRSRTILPPLQQISRHIDRYLCVNGHCPVPSADCSSWLIQDIDVGERGI